MQCRGQGVGGYASSPGGQLDGPLPPLLLPAIPTGPGASPHLQALPSLLEENLLALLSTRGKRMS